MLRPALFDSARSMLFDNAFDNFFGNDPWHNETFSTDVIDKGDHYLLQAELPGFDKEDIHIDLADDTLTISAQHSEERDENEGRKHDYIRRERRFSSYRRSFYVQGVTPEDIDASYKNGILEVAFPKKEFSVSEEPKKIEIK